jgi:hypothetical protein
MDNIMRSVLPPGPFADMASVIAEANVDLIEYPILKNEGFVAATKPLCDVSLAPVGGRVDRDRRFHQPARAG